MRMRNGALAILVVSLAAGIAACGGGSSSPSGGGTSSSSGGGAGSKAGTTINFLYRSTNPQYDSYIKWFVSTFEQQHSDIHVNVNSIPDADYHEKVSLVLKGNNPPDVFFSWEGGWAQTMVKDGFAAPLDSYYKKYHWDTELNSAANTLATFGGHQWFLPEYMSASAVWYNTDLFKKYNLTPPKTYDQLVQVANTLKSHGVAPFLLANQQQWEAQFDWTAYFVNKYGEPVYQQLLDHKIKWTDPRVVATFAQMKQWADTGWFLKGVNSMDFDGTAIVFWKRGSAGMWYQGSFILSKFITDGKLTQPVDWFPYPQVGTTTPSMSMFAENTYMINKASTHKAAAAELLDYLVSKPVQSRMVSEVGPFPANKSVSLSSQPAMVQRLGAAIAKSNGGFTWMHIDHALPPGIATPFLQGLQGVLSGTVTPQAAAEKTEQAAVRTLSGG
jgi:raffinose/stachyose/melibiose transport system substrate-binding protein